jgi:hypothetical protein
MMSTIQVQNKTKQRLAKHGTFSSTYDSIINKILDHMDACVHIEVKTNE